jgi:dTDP-4-amino-4,6-dideoxygalactose transaminase
MEKLASNGGKQVSEKMIPIAKPIIGLDVLSEIQKVLKSGYLRQGPITKKFEELFAETVGSKFAYAVCNGTAALHIAYLSILKPGDEVIVPSFTFLATASTVIHSRGKPIFSDIDPDTFLMDVEDVKEKITQKTKALVPVHLFGNAADINALQDLCQDHKLTLIHDSAQAHGTKYDGKDIGSIDDLGCYSFYPSKTMTTGEGGMVTTNNPELYKIGCLLRAHGDDARYHHVLIGLNYRLTEIAAILGIDQINKLNDFLKRRKECGLYLRDNISKIEGLIPQKTLNNVEHSYSYFSLKMDLEKFNCTRDKFIETLKAENIDCAVHYPIPLTKQPAILDLYTPEPCPVSDEISECIFSLPMHPALTDLDLENIMKGVNKVASYYRK